MSENRWCRRLGIEPPHLESVKSHPAANHYSLFLVALLEMGAPMTLEEVAARFEEVRIAPAAEALASLKRCRPGRPPAYLVDGRYSLDPHDAELDLWAFRLGLRPRVAPLRLVRPERGPLPGLDVPLTAAELDEAWKGASLQSDGSAQRLAVAVLDAQGGPLAPEEVLSRLNARTRGHLLRLDTQGFGRRGSAISVGPDGRWSISTEARDTVRGTQRPWEGCPAP